MSSSEEENAISSDDECRTKRRIEKAAQTKAAKLAAAQDFVTVTQGKKYAPKTIKNYTSVQNVATKWIREFHPECFVNDELQLPLSMVVVKGFYGDNSFWQSGKRKGQMKSYSAINGYRSGLKALYKKNGVATDEIDNFAESFFAGFKREVATKTNGGVKMYRGTLAVSL